jgi:polyvinyl alcohol dehydrogenase (cytochrome)
VNGSHYTPEEKITPANVGQLKVLWKFETGADVSGQPIVVNGVVYFGSWDGKEYAIDAKTGVKIWDYDAGQSTRSAAAYADGVIYFGDIAGFLHALDAKTGALKWKKRLDTHPSTVATSSPIVYQGKIYVGVSSHEEGAMLGKPDYACCTFRGSVVSLEAATGKVLWRFWVIPEVATEQGKTKRGKTLMGPAGGAVWSTVSLDTANKRVYVTTGNQYTPPASKFPNAIIALDMTTGKMLWSFQAHASDIWTFDCNNMPGCSDLDIDFGMAPVFFKGKGGKTLVGAGSKAGWFFALDPATGALEWKSEVGPGGKLGGIEFGGATDGERIYVGISNFPRQGSVAALDGVTGKLLWQTPSPDNKANFGMVTVTGRGDNRLVWAGSQGGFIRAYHAGTGKILWEYDTGGGVGGGATIVDGIMYIGSGYTFLRIGKPNNKLYAFGLESSDSAKVKP